MIRVLLTVFALLAFTGGSLPAQPATATAKGDPQNIVGFYIADKGWGYHAGNTYVVIESADGNGIAYAEVRLAFPRGGRGAGQVVEMILLYSDGAFTAEPTVTIMGDGYGAEVYAIMGP